MLLSSGRRVYIVNEVNRAVNNHGLMLSECERNRYTYTFILRGNNINYEVYVPRGTREDGGLITFKDMNKGSFFRVYLNTPEQVVQFIDFIWIPYLLSGGASMSKVSKAQCFKRNHLEVLAYGTQVTLHKNVVQ